MRIVGLGVDLAEIERVGRVLEKYPRFAHRCFTDHEREYAFRYAKPERRLAARFAGKEAVSPEQISSSDQSLFRRQQKTRTRRVFC